jgi:hypothetical protein
MMGSGCTPGGGGGGETRRGFGNKNAGVRTEMVERVYAALLGGPIADLAPRQMMRPAQNPYQTLGKTKP